MATNEENSRRIAIVGGGISGLAAAHRITELLPRAQFSLFETSDRLGGTIRTSRQDGYLIEHAADNFLHDPKNPWGMDLCRRLGFESEIIETDPSNRRAFIWFGERLHPVPEGFRLLAPSRWSPIFRSSLLSLSGKIRIFAEPSISPRNGSAEESLESFAVRRLGRQAFERLVQPLVAGIYTADASKLSVDAALPQFVKMEQQHGSLAKAVRCSADKAAVTESTDKTASGARYALFVAPRLGMESLVTRIAERIPAAAVRLQHRLQSIEKKDKQWQLSFEGGGRETFDAVILSCPASAVSNAILPLDRALADDLHRIEFASSAIVCLGYRRDQISHPLNGFGVVVPAIENRKVLAASFASIKFPDRAPDGCVLIRVFVGGVLQPQLAALPEAELIYLVRTQLGEMLGVDEEPHLTKVVRWPSAMPQYNLGHINRRDRIDNAFAKLHGIEFAGNALRGVGIPQCIHSGELAAERVAEQLTRSGV